MKRNCETCEYMGLSQSEDLSYLFNSCLHSNGGIKLKCDHWICGVLSDEPLDEEEMEEV